MNHDALVTHPTRRFILKIGSLAAGSLLLQAPGWAQTNPAVTKIGVIGSGKIGRLPRSRGRPLLRQD